MARPSGEGESQEGMTFEDWIFSIHLLFAATLVGSLVMSWIVVVSMRTADTPATTLNLHWVALVATGATIVGLGGVIVLGIWLAILRIEFHPWDGWVIAAIVLWAVATVALLRSFVEYEKPARKAKALIAAGQTGTSPELTALNRTAIGLALRVVASLAVVLIVVDMIWKPGA
jgi:hypothetical protein